MHGHVRLLRCFVGGAVTTLICRDLELVAADIHAAPPPRPFLAGIEEVDNARLAFAEAGCFGFREKIGCGVDDRCPEVGWLVRLEERFPHDLPVSPVE